MSFMQDWIIGRWNKLAYETSSQIKKLQKRNKQPTTKPDATLLENYPFDFIKASSFDEYQSFIENNKEELVSRNKTERGLITNKYGLLLKGFCFACGGPSLFFTRYNYHPVYVDGERMPNWHEGLVCSGCKMNNRMRGALHALDKTIDLDTEDSIYLTEQTTHMYRWFSKNYNNVMGSEYLGDSIPNGAENENKIRNEDLRELSFPDSKFDLIISMSVLEHIPDYLPALSEMYRCLKPGGTLVLHVPFFSGI
jgi:methyltransferase family protein